VSDNGLPDHAQSALDELTRLVHHLGEELAGYRKRAMSAESRLKTLDDLAAKGGTSPERAFELEQENGELRKRLEQAQARAKAMLERVRFLQQQHGTI
jgi:DNA repair ATPase RecN